MKLFPRLPTDVQGLKEMISFRLSQPSYTLHDVYRELDAGQIKPYEAIHIAYALGGRAQAPPLIR